MSESIRKAVIDETSMISVNTIEAMNKKCRILYLVGQLGPGGLERQLCYLLETIDRQRYAPIVVVWNYKKNDTYVRPIEKLGVRILALPMTRWGMGKLLAFRQIVKLLQPEVIHSYSFYTNFAAFYGALGHTSVAIGSVRSDLVRCKEGVGPLLGKLSARLPTIQIYNSVMAEESAKQSRSLFVPDRVVVVRNALNLDKFKKVKLPDHIPVRILAVGSLLEIKRWDRLIEAAEDLKLNNYNFHLRIAGDGPQRPFLEKQVERLGLAKYVVFLGYRNDIQDLLADSSFLVHTSDSEGCPNVVLEAMGCGRAVVATGVGDIPFVIEDGKTGFVVGKDDPANLTRQMSVLMKHSDVCRRMGEAGREKAEKEFGLDRLVSETLDVYTVAGWKR